MISIKTKEDIKTLAKSGAICLFVLNQVAKRIKPGMATIEIDKMANRIILARGAEPSFLNYQDYPASICVSVNDELVHGIPGPRIIESSDIVGIDVGVRYKGMCTDAAATVVVGAPNIDQKRLLNGVRSALNDSISMIKPGRRIGDIENACGETLRKFGLSPVLSLSGHGVGYEVHEDPSIKSDGKKGTGDLIKEGMVFAIEPMASLGNGKVYQGKDGWTIRTLDHSPTAHFEKTVAVTDRGYKILT